MLRLLFLLLVLVGMGQGKLVESKVEASLDAPTDSSLVLAELTPDLQAHAAVSSVAEDDVIAYVPFPSSSDSPVAEAAAPSLDSLPPLKRNTPANAALLEGAATTTRRRRSNRHGWGINDANRPRAQQRPIPARLTGAASTLTRANVRCVLCQYLMQRIHADMTSKKDEAAVPATAAVETSTASTEAKPADAEAQAAGAGETPEEAAAATSFIQTFQFASAEDKSRIESIISSAAAADAASAYPELFDHGVAAPRRFRHTDILAHRPARARFAQMHTQPDAAAREAARISYMKLYASVYSSFETLCAKRMPLAYLPYCNDMLKSYRFFAQGINYGDRPEAICMNGNFCDHRSYVRAVVHNTYVREPGDA